MERIPEHRGVRHPQSIATATVQSDDDRPASAATLSSLTASSFERFPVEVSHLTPPNFAHPLASSPPASPPSDKVWSPVAQKYQRQNQFSPPSTLILPTRYHFSLYYLFLLLYFSSSCGAALGL